jgi:hypothetical protein
MYGVRERMLLRHLVETEGLTQTAAAHQLGVHRKTLQRWIADGLLDTELDVITARYGPRPPVPTCTRGSRARRRSRRSRRWEPAD